MRLLLLVFTLVGCTSTTSGPHVYNNDDLQNTDCYRRYGGEHGYCDLATKWRLK